MKESTELLIKIDGMEYLLDVGNLTGREVGVLKRIGNIRGVVDIAGALGSADLEVVVALAGIAMARAGITPDYEKLLDVPLGDIVVTLPENPTEGEKITEPDGNPISPDSTT